MQVPRVMQAPIGPATTTDLVVAVSSAGGLGCLAASWTPIDVLRGQIREIQRSLDRPFSVNLVLAFDQRERLELLAEEEVPVISFSWGIDESMIVRARAARAAVLVQVGDVKAGVQAAAAGADALIAQGVEAGGHVQGRTPLHRLVRRLRRETRIPVLAAGGIAEGSSAAAAMAAGASGIVAGTAYLAAQEADVHPLYLDRVLAALGTDTCLTGVFDVGWPNASHRVLRNSTLDAWNAAGCPGPGSRPGEHEPAATRAGSTVVRYSDAQPTRDTEGDIAAMALYGGCGLDHVNRTQPAATITARMLTATEPRV